ncbi:hypothetical protein D9758_010478 [Tetrapyrgos nigripes]|uniref:Peptidase C45 hydrolase domain-containing protein n=1 Tax=Tetrapyrgos nigripes TaxID=182062 RepID=A0A8H5D0S4_9AGAR|nr:hypothetical protein D9758_010478 [Tetrapyrgos nigripes]
MSPLTVELSGSPREIGLKHGRRLAAQIRAQIKVYDAMFRSTSKLDWSAVREIAKEYAATIESLTPEIHTEIHAIAEGAGLDPWISLGWKYSGTEVVLCQNWDWTARVKDNLVMMSIDQPGKPKIWMVTEAGIVGKIGFNSSSVGVCLNAIRARPTNSRKLPIHLALRVALESESAQAAIGSLESLGVASAQHVLIADTKGPLSLELSPVGNVILQPNAKGFIAHTNHFLENKFVDEPPWLANSPVRLMRVNDLTSKLISDKQLVNSKILRERIFSDMYNAPGSICCQEDPARPIETRPSTLFCIIMKFVQGQSPTAEVVWGKPGSGEEGDVLHMPW